MPRNSNLSSVLARFEETIEQNNAAGVCSGMYLTNQVSRSPTSSKKKSTGSRRHSCHGPNSSNQRVQGRRLSTGGSLHKIEAGTYRNMLKNTDATINTASTAETSEDEWDPFNDDNDEDDDTSFCDDFCNDDDGSAVHTVTERKERPKDRKSAGRRSNRVTKTKKSRKDVNKTERDSQKSLPPSNAEAEHQDDDGDQSDDDDGGGFNLTYISARDKFTSLVKQNSDRQLCKQPSRRKLLSGLKMTSKENVLSTSSNHSTSSNSLGASSHRRESLSREGSSRSIGRGSRSSTVRRASSKSLLDFEEDSSPRRSEKRKSAKSKERAPEEKTLSSERESSHSRSSKLGSSSHHRTSRRNSIRSDKRSDQEDAGRLPRRSSLRVSRTFQHTKAEH